jgi:hypothetical protein
MKKFRYSLLIVTCFILTASSTQAQSNAVGIGPSLLGLKVKDVDAETMIGGGLNYARAFGEKMALALSVDYNTKKETVDFGILGGKIDITQTVLTIQPEFHYFVTESLNGLYFGPDIAFHSLGAKVGDVSDSEGKFGAGAHIGYMHRMGDNLNLGIRGGGGIIFTEDESTTKFGGGISIAYVFD